MTDPRRAIPSVERLLGSPAFAPLLGQEPRHLVTEALQQVQTALREAIGRGETVGPGIDDPEWYAARTRDALRQVRQPSLRPLINATGVVLHTNLGRAPLAPEALDAIAAAARGYSNLEYDLDQGARGSRYSHCVDLLTRLTGAEAALVVNNNAAALVLALNTLAQGREAVISRGELVEIGGSFRIPEIMARSGALMVEVGATNRTRAADYDAALGEDTGVILKVHRSNFRIEGFTEEASVAELVTLAEPRGIPVIHDLGSGLLIEAGSLGLPPEPTPGEVLRAGAAMVTMSGDKLLGGPQAGILVGRADLVDRMRRNPLCRALRVDKLTLAALEATLALYLDPGKARAGIPALRMLSAAPASLRDRAERVAARLHGRGIAADTVVGASTVGGGAFPGVELETTLVRVASPSGSATGLERRLRQGNPPVIGRVQEDRLLLDVRTVLPEQEEALVEALAAAWM